MNTKKISSLILASLTIGAANTAFASSNPFSDVPADHWAYDAVTKLVEDGVVNGYPEGTYQGKKAITRYEMAQMVAKAMTKNDIGKTDKGLVDKLAAEFSQELDNFGVRIAELEKKADNVKWSGELRYRHTSSKLDSNNNVKVPGFNYSNARKNTNHYFLRLEPEAFIGNSGWVAKSRIAYTLDVVGSKNSEGRIDRFYVQGPLFGSTARLGKSPLFSGNINGIGKGLVIDDKISGAQFMWGTGKAFKVNAVVGKYNNSPATGAGNDSDFQKGRYEGDYYSLEAGYAPKKSRLSGYGGYYTLRNTKTIGKDIADQWIKFKDASKGNQNIWSTGLEYKFSKDLKARGVYSHGNIDGDITNRYMAGQNKAYNVNLSYKEANTSKPNSWGVYAAYRYLGMGATIKPNSNGAQRGTKGWEVGASYIPAENIKATMIYFKGKNIGMDNIGYDSEYSKLFGQVQFFF